MSGVSCEAREKKNMVVMDQREERKGEEKRLKVRAKMALWIISKTGKHEWLD